MSMSQTGWWSKRLTGYDLESDSANPLDARIVTAAVIGCGGGQATVERSWILKPVRPIADEAAAIHGYPTERAEAEGMDHAAGVDLIAAEVCLSLSRGIPVVAFVASYDFTVLACELARHGLPSLTERLGGDPSPIIDPYVLDKFCDKWRRGSRKLIDQASFYGAPLAAADAHGASADAITAARVAYRIGQIGENDTVRASAGLSDEAGVKYRKVAAMSLPELHAFQVATAAAQAADLVRYRKSKGDPVGDISGAWPIRTLAPVAASPP